MSHYKANLRDLEFNLFEVFGAGDRLGQGVFDAIDEDTARAFLAQMVEVAEGPLAESFVDADRNPPVFDPATNSVTLPESFKKSYQALVDSEAWQLDVLPELGGIRSPRQLVWAISELVLGANPAIHMYASGYAFAGVFHKLGTPQQKEWAKLFVEKHWGSTMVLTEPDAGSDVGAGRTKAIPQADGTWHLEGVKRFITSGDQDMTENIIHYVLARPVGVEGAGGPGTKGLSLFMVPKFQFDDAGNLGERNGVYVTNVEKKMGLKVSATCELTFGDKHPAVGYLVGEVHDGIRQMFNIIEAARMMVGTKAIATLSTGYLNALDYAKNRVQGADLTRQTDKTAPRVTIIHHPDVRRSLLRQKSYAEGLRALVHYTASVQDQLILARAAGDLDAAESFERLNDLLLPMVKGGGSERSYELLGAESLQTFGGSGFLQDYPIEQYIRDAKIDTLYEGTTAIQGQDFFFRKIVRDSGKALGVLAGEIASFIESESGNGRLKNERALLKTALDDVQAMVGWSVTQLMSMQDDPANIYKVGLNTTRLLLSTTDLVVGWLLLRQADVALRALDAGGPDADFYTGKIASARFFASTVLPELTARRAVLEATTLDVMEVPEGAF
ncbi:acyl-CoA dehydrogenase [Cryptosporangium phraense]|uniref:Broad-specificity linear acyl-CoA dehydrogenase FadE5 n=1 Tax=Cryptosporangium phraense TaxID=2593070 RepID=A0A545AF67_9ACTN|nr:acyl-CoA dehydrogenase [Cryptosporangium phraense]TQS39978.1 acyl-CoA dehydrogenase [Cryptosporangium phraense]